MLLPLLLATAALPLVKAVAIPDETPLYLPGDLPTKEELERIMTEGEAEQAAEDAAQEAERIKNFDWGGLGPPSKNQIEPLPPRSRPLYEPSTPVKGAEPNPYLDLEQDRANPYRRIKVEQPRPYRPPPTATERIAQNAAATVHIWAPIAAALAFLAALGFALYRWARA